MGPRNSFPPLFFQNQNYRSNVICMLVKEFLEHVKLFDICIYRQEIVKEQNNGYKCKRSGLERMRYKKECEIRSQRMKVTKSG